MIEVKFEYKDLRFNYELKHKNIKSINVYVKDKSIVQVTAPNNATPKDIEKVLIKGYDNLKKELTRLEKEYNKPELVDLMIKELRQLKSQYKKLSTITERGRQELTNKQILNNQVNSNQVNMEIYKKGWLLHKYIVDYGLAKEYDMDSYEDEEFSLNNGFSVQTYKKPLPNIIKRKLK